MSLVYDEYLAEHIGNVNKGLHWMLDNLGLSQEEKSAIETAMLEFNHDESKYSTEEYNAYDQYFYGGNRSYKVVQDFNYAWLHHIHQNPHHWQYWVLLEDDPDAGLPYKTLPIPLPYIFEMISDWWSFSWKSGNLFEIFNWYAEHRDKQYIDLNSRMILERILEKIWDVLVMQETVRGRDISEIEAQYKRFWVVQDASAFDGYTFVPSGKIPDNVTMESNPEPVPDIKSTLPGIGINGVFAPDFMKRYDEELFKLKHSDSEPIGKVIGTHESENGLEVTVEYSKDKQEFWKHLIEDGENVIDKIVELGHPNILTAQEMGSLVKHSDEEDDEDLYGVPELKKFPMPDKKHVKSAIRFFNYVDPKYEKELAEAIIEKAEEFGMDLESDISVGDENRLKKYLPEKKEES